MIGLGIDTGGTYTDAVIYNSDTGVILANAKSQTTRQDLKIGITNVLKLLPVELLSQCKMSALSTTLATNACVENKGGRGKLIFIGIDEKSFRENYRDYGIDSSKDVYLLQCHIGSDPDNDTQPDWDLFLEDMKSFLLDAQCISIVQLFAKSRGGAYEKQAADLLRTITDIPVIMGHELFPDLNAYRRGAGALLNARLIPVIYDFLTAIKSVFHSFHLDVPTVIVRSDGSLMSESFAMERPVETLLCGPAASIIGAMELAHESNSIIVDIGGTTTDVAIVKDGMAKRSDDGIDIGKWKTFVKGLYVDTFGLGGDTAIRYNHKGEAYLENYRMIPLCSLAKSYPSVITKLQALDASMRSHTCPLHEFFCLIKDIDALPYYTESEKNLCRALKNGPMSLEETADFLKTDVYSLNVSRLEKDGIILRSGLTPTDMMHILGDFTSFSKEASLLAANFFIRSTKHSSPEALASHVYDLVIKKLYCALVRILFFTQHDRLSEVHLDAQMEKCIETAYDLAKNNLNNEAAPYFSTIFTTKATLIGVGAPTHIFLPYVAKLLGTKVIIPEHAAVANAVGAIVGKVSVTETVEIMPMYHEASDTEYEVTTYDHIYRFKQYEEAFAFAQKTAMENAQNKARRQGALGHLTFTSNIHRKEGHSNYGNIWLSESITVIASGEISSL